MARKSESNFAISWRTLATIEVVLIIGLVSALVTVGLMHDVDGLSTVALVLAVIAFVAQLVIFTLQSAQAGAQLQEARELNRETTRLLAESSIRIADVHSMVNQHNELFLRMQAAKAGADVDAPASNLPTARGEAGRLPSKSRIRAVSLLASWPTLEAAERYLQILEGLDSTARKVLSLDVSSYVMSKQMDLEPDLKYGPTDDVLIAADLVRRSSESGRADVIEPTEEGIQVSRLLFARFPPPDDYAEVRSRIMSIREDTSQAAIQGAHYLFDITTEDS